MKALKLLLAVGAVSICSTAMAEVTEVYHIDYTAEDAVLLDSNENLSIDTENGLTYTYPGEGWVQFKIGDNIPVEELGFYTITIVGKASEEFTCSTAFMQWGAESNPKFTFTTEWSEIKAVAQAQATSNFFFMFQPWAWNGTVNIKSITVTTGDEGYDSAKLCLKASNIVKKENPWDNQITYNFATPLEQGGTYNISFDICGDADGKINLWGSYAVKTSEDDEDFLKNVWGGYDPTGGWYGPEYDVLSKQWTHYELTPTFAEACNAGGTDYPVACLCGLQFCCGNNFEGTLYLDNVVVTKVDSEESCIPNGDFCRLIMGNWGKGWMHDFDLEIANGPDDATTAIAAIEATDAAPVYYNLQGVRVENPNNGIYIVKRGNKVTKQAIR